MMKHISSEEDFLELVRSGDRFFLLKHSSTCPVSKKAFGEVEGFLDEIDFEVYYLVVQRDRGLSDFVGEYFSVKHESPQLFLIEDGLVVWHDSHFLINRDEMSRVV